VLGANLQAYQMLAGCCIIADSDQLFGFPVNYSSTPRGINLVNFILQVEGRNAQHSMHFTLKSELGVRGGLSKVGHACVLPWSKSPSNQSPNCPSPAPTTKVSVQP